MADRCRRVARERFHPEVVAARTYDVYQRALASGATATAAPVHQPDTGRIA